MVATSQTSIAMNAAASSMIAASARRAWCASSPAPNDFESATPARASRRDAAGASATAASTIAPSAGPRPASSMPSTRSVTGLAQRLDCLRERRQRAQGPLLAHQRADGGGRLIVVERARRRAHDLAQIAVERAEEDVLRIGRAPRQRAADRAQVQADARQVLAKELRDGAPLEHAARVRAEALDRAIARVPEGGRQPRGWPGRRRRLAGHGPVQGRARLGDGATDGLVE